MLAQQKITERWVRQDKSNDFKIDLIRISLEGQNKQQNNKFQICFILLQLFCSFRFSYHSIMKKESNLEKDKPKNANTPVVNTAPTKKKANSLVQKTNKVQEKPPSKAALIKISTEVKGPPIIATKTVPKKIETKQAPMIKNNMNQKKEIKKKVFNENHFRLLTAKDPTKQIAAIIVTFCNGHSYDELFTSVEQKTMEGTQVLVYSCNAKCISFILQAFDQKPQSQTLREFILNIKSVDPDCVVFNWECSSSYTDKHFTQGKQYLFKFVGRILEAGHMAMFSDFSLKALINQWDSSILGQNPFVQTGQTSSPVTLHFKSSILKECPSAQLQSVGELAEGGECHIECLANTILYSINENNIDKQKYTLQLLTINKSNYPENPKLILKIDEIKGSAGHVLLRYKNGGCLLTSMGHWIELMKIDTSEKKLFEIAEKQFGSQYAKKMKQQYDELDEGGGGGGGGEQRKKAYLKSKAVAFVQNQAPCTNMNKKKKG